MSGNFKKEDLRIIKTNKALIDALNMLLKSRTFSQITVNDLCEEALVSRTAFYTHFNDKYDLLNYKLMNLKPNIIQNKDFTYEHLEKVVNCYVDDNSTIIKNLVENADDEVMDMLHDFMISILDISAANKIDGKINPEYTVFTRFCAGGMVNFLIWQVKNRFPTDLQMMNIYVYEILKTLLKQYSAEKYTN